jgi:hypothetical protein
MSLEFWYALLFASTVYVVLWAFGRWILPRLHLSDGSVETQLRTQIMDLEKRLFDAEQKNKVLDGKYAEALTKIGDLESKQDWLLEQYRVVGTRATELERQVDALNRGETPAQDGIPALIVAIGDDAALQLDVRCALPPAWNFNVSKAPHSTS